MFDGLPLVIYNVYFFSLVGKHFCSHGVKWLSVFLFYLLSSRPWFSRCCARYWGPGYMDASTECVWLEDHLCLYVCALSLIISGAIRTLMLSMGFIEGKLCTKCQALELHSGSHHYAVVGSHWVLHSAWWEGWLTVFKALFSNWIAEWPRKAPAFLWESSGSSVLWWSKKSVWTWRVYCHPKSMREGIVGTETLGFWKAYVWIKLRKTGNARERDSGMSYGLVTEETGQVADWMSLV